MRTPGKRLAMLIPCQVAASRSLAPRQAKPSALAIKAAPERSYLLCALIETGGSVTELTVHLLHNVEHHLAK